MHRKAKLRDVGLYPLDPFASLAGAKIRDRPAPLGACPFARGFEIDCRFMNASCWHLEKP
jgi:hypothetical protein